jgi:adenine-specific DNA-methyltransferase
MVSDAVSSMDVISAFQTAEIQGEFRGDHLVVLYNGDVLDFIRAIPDGSVRLIVTSPPYNLGKEYETRVALADYISFQSGVIKELVRTLASNGSICWQVGNHVADGEIFPLDVFYYPVFSQCGLRLRNRIVWHFGHGLHCSKRFSGRYETLLWFTKSDEYVFNLDPVRVASKYPGKTNFRGPNKGKPSGNPLGKNPSDVWEIVVQDWETGMWEIPNVKANHPEKTIHPCQFPIELVQRCVLALTDEGDWVMDPYMGVGSSIVAAIMHGRRGAGCDKEKSYTDEARRRVVAYQNGSLPVRPLGRPVYEPTGKEKVSQIPLDWQGSR